MQTFFAGKVGRVNPPKLQGKHHEIRMNDGATMTFDVYEPYDTKPEEVNLYYNKLFFFLCFLHLINIMAILEMDSHTHLCMLLVFVEGGKPKLDSHDMRENNISKQTRFTFHHGTSRDQTGVIEVKGEHSQCLAIDATLFLQPKLLHRHLVALLGIFFFSAIQDTIAK